MSGRAATDTLDLRTLYGVLADYQRGNFSVRMPADRTGLAGKICDALNTTIERNERLVKELERLSTVVGTAGNGKPHAQLPSAEGAWCTTVESVNSLVSDLVQPTTEVTKVSGVVAVGDLSKKVNVDIKSDILELKNTVDTIVDQLSSFAAEVTRVAKEVGVERQLGDQAGVRGVAGSWQVLTDHVNQLASNLSVQLRDLSKVAAVFVALFNRQEALRIAQEDLELRVADRTRELADANLALSAEIQERAKSERERVQLLRREQAARLEADRANRLKDEFLATLSHELRTPLNAIMGWAHVLGQSTHDRDTVQRAAAVIRQNASSQAQLIDDILDVSRIIGGRLVLDTALVSLSAVIDDAIDSLMPAAAAKAIDVSRNLDRDISVIGDRDRLQQVVWNLVSNAFKFTPKNGRVVINLKEVEGDAEVEVIDTGIGISAEFLPCVFDRFRQADSSMSRRHNGLGLGMAIVRHLVELHGGTVSVESGGEGKGATFRIRLARHTGAAPELPAAAARLEPEPEVQSELEHLQGVHVLIVEDDADSRTVLAVLLQRRGALVEAVGSAKEAYDRVSHRRPDVLVSDIGMPGEDGYSLIRRLRLLGGERRLAAIALTAYARQQDADAALSAGYDRHLSKPVAPADLIRAIKSVTLEITNTN